MLVIAGRCGAFRTCGKCPYREQPKRVAVYRGAQNRRNYKWQTQSLGVWLAGFIHFRKHNDICLIVSKRGMFAYLDCPNPHRRYPSLMYLLPPIYPNAARYRFSNAMQATVTAITRRKINATFYGNLSKLQHLLSLHTHHIHFPSTFASCFITKTNWYITTLGLWRHLRLGNRESCSYPKCQLLLTLGLAGHWAPRTPQKVLHVGEL